MSKFTREIVRILLDCPIGTLLCYCSGEPDGKSVSVVFSVKNAEGQLDPRQLRAKGYLLLVLDINKARTGFAHDNGDYDIGVAFPSVEAFLAYLKRYGFAPTRLKNHAQMA